MYLHKNQSRQPFRPGRTVTRRFAANSLLCLALAFATIVQAAPPQNLYWDINGSNNGSGGPTPNGTWDLTTPNWDVSSAGTGASVDWIGGVTANFSAGSDATGSYTVFLSGTQTAAAISFKNGTNTLTGGTLNLTGSGLISVSAAPIKGIISSVISGSVGLTKTSSGELVLHGANTFTGNLTNKAGIVTLDNNQAAGNGSIVLNPIAPVSLHSTQPFTALTNNISLPGSTSTIEVDADQGNTISLSGVISGAHNWSANGLGTLILNSSSANTFAGVFTVAQGTVVVAQDGALGNTVNGVAVNLGATLAFDGGFSYTGNKQIILNGTGIGGGAALDNLTGNNTFYGSISLAADSTVGAEAGGSLTLVGPIAGNNNLTKVGNGTLVMTSGGNTYSTTLVDEGTFYVQSGSTAGTGLVTVNNGATLVGVTSSGNSIPGGVNLSGAIQADDGSSPSFLTSSLQTWNGGANYQWSINDPTGSAGNDPGWSLLNISGTLTINANSSSPVVISIASLDSSFYTPGLAANFDNTLEYSWIIATASGGISGFDPTAFLINTNGFQNDIGNGAFVVRQSGNNLVLYFVQKPQITASPSSQTVDECTNITLSVTATGTAPLSYQWFQNGSPISTAIASSYAISGVQPANAGAYSVTVSNISGSSATSPTATLTVIDPPPVISGVPANMVVTNSGANSGPCGQIVSWTPPTAIDNCSVASFAPNHNPGDTFPVGTTLVTYTATDNNGQVSTASFTVTVIDVSTTTVTSSDSPDIYGSPITFQSSVSACSGTPPAGTITFKDGIETLGSVVLNGSAQATWTTTNLQAGTHVITAVYSGDPYYTTSTSSVFTQNVEQATLTVTNVTANNKNYDGTPVAALNVSAATLVGLVPGDTVLLNTGSATGSFATSTIGTNKVVTISGLTISGLSAPDYTLTQPATTANIAYAPLTVTANNGSKVYGTTTNLGNTAFTTSGTLYANDSVATVTLTSDGSVATAIAGGHGIVPTAAIGSGLTNYNITYENGTLLVTHATLTITANSSSKTYGLTNSFAGTEFTPSGLLNEDSVTSVTLTSAGATNTAIVGSYPILAATAIGNGLANYDVFYVNGSLTVTPALLVVTANDTNRVYGTTNPVFTASFTGFMNGEDSTVISGTPDFSCAVATNAPVGVYSNAIVLVDAGTLTATNYTFPPEEFTNGTLTVAVAAVTPNITASNKIYDAGTNASLTSQTLAGVVGSDDVNLVVGAASFADKNVGTNKTVTATGLTLGGANATNYILSATQATTTANITSAALTVTATGGDKTYDANSNAVVTLSGNAIGTDVVTYNYASALFATQNAGLQTVTANGITLSGADAGNYTWNSTTSTSATIFRRRITVTAVTDSKIYDGTPASAGVPTTNPGGGPGIIPIIVLTPVQGLASGDTAAFTQTFDTAFVGVSKTLTPAGNVNDGNEGLNYIVNFVNNASGQIGEAPLTITANDGSKIYGTTTNLGNTAFTTSGTLYANDSVTTVTLTSDGSGATAIAGGHGIVPTAAIGSGLTNYNITYENGTLLVTHATLTITANSSSKTYGLTNSFAGTEFTPSGLLNEDSVTSVTLTSAGATNTAIVGSYPIGATAATGSGLGNYDIFYGNGTLIVTPALLSVTANDTNRVYGATNPVFTASFSGFMNGDDATMISGTPDFTCAMATNAPVGVYSNAIVLVDAGTLTATNYTFPAEEFTNGTLTVAVAALTPNITASNKIYDAGTNATLTSQTLAGVVGSDDVNLVVGAASFADKNVGTNQTVTATGLTLAGANATNYILSASQATTTANITSAALTVTATGGDKTYDANSNAVVTLSGNAIGTDVVAYNYTSAFFATRNAGLQAVTVNGITLSGDDAGNYTWNSIASTSATISTRNITVTAVTDSKVYDGTRVSSGVPTISPGGVPIITPVIILTPGPGLAGGDTAAFTQTFDTAFVGVSKTLTPAGNVNDGNEGLNYIVNFVNNASGQIGEAPLTITANDGSKIYGTTTNLGNTAFTTSDTLYTNDSVTTVTLTSDGSVATAIAGGHGIVPTAAIGSGLTNYNITYVNGTLNVTPAALIVMANPENKASGTALNFAGTEFTTSGTVYPGDTVASVTLTSAGAASSAPQGSYSIIPSNAAGTGVGNYQITYLNGTLTVANVPQITSQPLNQTNNAGSTASFTVAASSLVPISYQWNKNGAPLVNGGNISGATNATLSIATVSDTDATSYTVTVINFAGNVTSEPATLSIIDEPVVTNIQPAIQTNNASTTATFTVSPSGTAPFTYQWIKITAATTNLLTDGGNISGSTNDTLIISNLLAADQAQYFVTVSNPAGSSTTNGTLIVVDPAILVQPANVTTSLGGGVTFSVTAAGTSTLYYQWQQDGFDLPGETASNLVLNGITDSDVADYTVTISNAYGTITSSNATLTITHPPQIVTPPASIAVSLGNSATLSVSVNGQTPFTYQWKKNGTDIIGATNSILWFASVQVSDAASYSVQIHNRFGTILSNPAILTVVVAPIITIAPQSQTVYPGQSASFSVGYSGSQPNFQWFTNGIALSGATNGTLTLNNVSAANAGNYTVALSNLAGAATSAPPAHLTVLQPPVITQQPTNIVALTNQSFAFNVVATGQSPLAYQWYFNNSKLPSATHATLSLNQITAGNAGAYFVTITNTAGSVTSSIVQLAVYNTTVPTLAITHANGSVQIQLDGVSTYPYLIEASSDLVTWVPVQTNTAPFTFTETNLFQFSNRYYRANYQP